MDYINTFLTEIGDMVIILFFKIISSSRLFSFKTILVIIVTGDGKDSASQLVINCTDKSKTDIVERAGKRYLTLNKHFLL